MQTAVSRVLRIGRATMLAIGVGVSLALVLGAATVALAAVPGDPFKLGRVNQINAITTLVGNLNDPMLRIDNNGPGTALDLQVQPGKQPLKVNSSQRVVNLNSDRLDGKDSSAFLQEASDGDDFLPNDTYVNVDTRDGSGSGDTVFAFADCDPGDKLLGGGGQAVDPDVDTATASAPFIGGQGWDFQIRDNGTPSSVDAFALCADFPPEH